VIGRVVVDLTALVADGEVRIVERGDTVALNRPGILLGENDDAGGAVHLRLLANSGYIRAQPIGPYSAFSADAGVHDVADGGIGVFRILGPNEERRAHVHVEGLEVGPEDSVRLLPFANPLVALGFEPRPGVREIVLIVVEVHPQPDAVLLEIRLARHRARLVPSLAQQTGQLDDKRRAEHIRVVIDFFWLFHPTLLPIAITVRSAAVVTHSSPRHEAQQDVKQ